MHVIKIAIKMAKSENTNLIVGVVIPSGAQAISLKSVADFKIKLSNIDLYQFLLPQTITLSNNKIIRCPKDWQ